MVDMRIEEFCGLDVVRKAEQFQELSKKLKSFRGSSHPERSIGQTSRKRKKTCDSDADSIAQWVMEHMEQMLTSLDNANACHHYFFLSLLLDVLKCMPTFNFVAATVNYAASLMNAGLYLPNVHRCLDVYEKCLQFIEKRTDDAVIDILIAVSNSLISIHQHLLSQYSLQDIYCTRHQRSDSCVFVDDSYVYSVGAHFLLTILAVTTMADHFITSADAKEVYEEVSSLLRLILDNVTLVDLVHSLAECDADIVKFLLELMRLVAVQIRVLDKAYPSARRALEVASAYPIKCFIVFVVCELCLDVSPLVDLVTGAETDALLMLLRVLKSIAVTPQSVAEAIAYISCISVSINCRDDRTCSGTAIYICSEEILCKDVYGMSSAKPHILCDIGADLTNAVASATSSPRPQYHSSVSIGDICDYFTSLHERLSSMTAKKVIPFNCAPLLRRLSEAIHALNEYTSDSRRKV